MSLVIIQKIIERMKYQHSSGKDVYPRDIFALQEMVESQYETLQNLLLDPCELSETDKAMVTQTIGFVDELAIERLQAMEI